MQALSAGLVLGSVVAAVVIAVTGALEAPPLSQPSESSPCHGLKSEVEAGVRAIRRRSPRIEIRGISYCLFGTLAPMWPAWLMPSNHRTSDGKSG